MNSPTAPLMSEGVLDPMETPKQITDNVEHPSDFTALLGAIGT